MTMNDRTRSGIIRNAERSASRAERSGGAA
jgi:hypothetical protein